MSCLLDIPNRVISDSLWLSGRGRDSTLIMERRVDIGKTFDKKSTTLLFTLKRGTKRHTTNINVYIQVPNRVELVYFTSDYCNSTSSEEEAKFRELLNNALWEI